MADNRIEIYQKNCNTITLTVSGFDITGYTPYFTVKKKISSSTIDISSLGTVTDPSTAVFNLSSTDCSVDAGLYVYDATIEADNSIYTVVKDSLEILDGVRY